VVAVVRELALFLCLAGALQFALAPPPALPSAAQAALRQSLAASAAQAHHVWRDTPPVNPDRTVNACVDIMPIDHDTAAGGFSTVPCKIDAP
jgi:hypothetical protein